MLTTKSGRALNQFLAIVISVAMVYSPSVPFSYAEPIMMDENGNQTPVIDPANVQLNNNPNNNNGQNQNSPLTAADGAQTNNARGASDLVINVNQTTSVEPGLVRKTGQKTRFPAWTRKNPEDDGWITSPDGGKYRIRDDGDLAFDMLFEEGGEGNYRFEVTAKNIKGNLPDNNDLLFQYDNFEVDVLVDGVVVDTILIPAGDDWETVGVDLDIDPVGVREVSFRWKNDFWVPGLYDANINFRDIVVFRTDDINIVGHLVRENGTETEIQAIDGVAKGHPTWRQEGDAIWNTNDSRILVYDVHFEAAGTHNIALQGRNHPEAKLHDSYDNFLVKVTVDGVEVGVVQIPASDFGYQIGELEFEVAQAGAAEVVLEWMNDDWHPLPLNDVRDANLMLRNVVLNKVINPIEMEKPFPPLRLAWENCVANEIPCDYPHPQNLADGDNTKRLIFTPDAVDGMDAGVLIISRDPSRFPTQILEGQSSSEIAECNDAANRDIVYCYNIEVTTPFGAEPVPSVTRMFAQDHGAVIHMFDAPNQYLMIDFSIVGQIGQPEPELPNGFPETRNDLTQSQWDTINRLIFEQEAIDAVLDDIEMKTGMSRDNFDLQYQLDITYRRHGLSDNPSDIQAIWHIGYDKKPNPNTPVARGGYAPLDYHVFITKAGEITVVPREEIILNDGNILIRYGDGYSTRYNPNDGTHAQFRNTRVQRDVNTITCDSNGENCTRTEVAVTPGPGEVVIGIQDVMNSVTQGREDWWFGVLDEDPETYLLRIVVEHLNEKYGNVTLNDVAAWREIELDHLNIADLIKKGVDVSLNDGRHFVVVVTGSSRSTSLNLHVNNSFETELEVEHIKEIELELYRLDSSISILEVETLEFTSHGLQCFQAPCVSGDLYIGVKQMGVQELDENTRRIIPIRKYFEGTITDMDPNADPVVTLEQITSITLNDGSILRLHRDGSATHMKTDGTSVEYAAVRVQRHVNQIFCDENGENCGRTRRGAIPQEFEQSIGMQDVMETTTSGHEDWWFGIPTPLIAPGTEEAVERAIEDLANRLNLNDNEKANIEVLRAQPATWTNGCVGWALPGQICTMAIVNDYLVILKYAANEYEYHANALDPAKRSAITAMLDMVQRSNGNIDLESIVIESSTLIDFDGIHHNIPHQIARHAVHLKATDGIDYHYTVEYWQQEILLIRYILLTHLLTEIKPATESRIDYQYNNEDPARVISMIYSRPGQQDITVLLENPVTVGGLVNTTNPDFWAVAEALQDLVERGENVDTLTLRNYVQDTSAIVCTNGIPESCSIDVTFELVNDDWVYTYRVTSSWQIDTTYHAVLLSKEPNVDPADTLLQSIVDFLNQQYGLGATVDDVVDHRIIGFPAPHNIGNAVRSAADVTIRVGNVVRHFVVILAGDTFHLDENNNIIMTPSKAFETELSAEAVKQIALKLREIDRTVEIEQVTELDFRDHGIVCAKSPCVSGDLIITVQQSETRYFKGTVTHFNANQEPTVILEELTYAELLVALLIDKIRAEALKDLGQPFEGFTPSMYMQALPGLEPIDFHNVRAHQGIYTFENGELVFTYNEGAPIHSAGNVVSEEGMRTLVANILDRLNEVLNTEVDVNRVFRIINADPADHTTLEDALRELHGDDLHFEIYEQWNVNCTAGMPNPDGTSTSVCTSRIFYSYQSLDGEGMVDYNGDGDIDEEDDSPRVYLVADARQDDLDYSVSNPVEAPVEKAFRAEAYHYLQEDRFPNLVYEGITVSEVRFLRNELPSNSELYALKYWVNDCFPCRKASVLYEGTGNRIKPGSHWEYTINGLLGPNDDPTFIPKDEMDPNVVAQIEQMIGDVLELVGKEIVDRRFVDGGLVHKYHFRAVSGGEAYLHLKRHNGIRYIVQDENGNITETFYPDQYGITINVNGLSRAPAITIERTVFDGVENVGPTTQSGVMTIGSTFILTVPVEPSNWVSGDAPLSNAPWVFSPFTTDEERIELEIAIHHTTAENPLKLRDVKITSTRELLVGVPGCNELTGFCPGLRHIEINYKIGSDLYSADAIFNHPSQAEGPSWRLENVTLLPPIFGFDTLEEALQALHGEHAIITIYDPNYRPSLNGCTPGALNPDGTSTSLCTSQIQYSFQHLTSADEDTGDHGQYRNARSHHIGSVSIQDGRYSVVVLENTPLEKALQAEAWHAIQNDIADYQTVHFGDVMIVGLHETPWDNSREDLVNGGWTPARYEFGVTYTVCTNDGPCFVEGKDAEGYHFRLAPTPPHTETNIYFVNILGNTPPVYPDEVLAAREDLAQRLSTLGVQVDDITITEHAIVNCASGIANCQPYYTVTLLWNRNSFYYEVPVGGTPRLDGERSAAFQINIAKHDLSNYLNNFPIGEIDVVNVNLTVWSDSCLGIINENGCADVVTPGWIITLTDGNYNYAYHTDLSGRVLRAFEEPNNERRSLVDALRALHGPNAIINIYDQNYGLEYNCSPGAIGPDGPTSTCTFRVFYSFRHVGVNDDGGSHEVNSQDRVFLIGDVRQDNLYYTVNNPQDAPMEDAFTAEGYHELLSILPAPISYSSVSLVRMDLVDDMSDGTMVDETYELEYELTQCSGIPRTCETTTYLADGSVYQEYDIDENGEEATTHPVYVVENMREGNSEPPVDAYPTLIEAIAGLHEVDTDDVQIYEENIILCVDGIDWGYCSPTQVFYSISQVEGDGSRTRYYYEARVTRENNSRAYWMVDQAVAANRDKAFRAEGYEVLKLRPENSDLEYDEVQLAEIEVIPTPGAFGHESYNLTYHVTDCPGSHGACERPTLIMPANGQRNLLETPITGTEFGPVWLYTVNFSNIVEPPADPLMVLVAEHLGVDISDIANFRVIPLPPHQGARNSVRQGADVTLTDGRHYVAILDGSTVHVDADHNPIYTVTKVFETELEVEAIKAIIIALNEFPRWQVESGNGEILWFLDITQVTTLNYERHTGRFYCEGTGCPLWSGDLEIVAEWNGNVRNFEGEIRRIFNVLPADEYEVDLEEIGIGNPINPLPNHPPEIRVAAAHLANQLRTAGVTIDDIGFGSIQNTQWFDPCWGLCNWGGAILPHQQRIPGYIITLIYDGEEFIYHSAVDSGMARFNEAASVNHLIPPLVEILENEFPFGLMGLKYDSAELTVWGNSCLGVNDHFGSCAEVLTPGWIIRYKALNGTIYRFHTDLHDRVLYNGPLQAVPANIAIALTQHLGDEAELTIYEDGFDNECLPNKPCTDKVFYSYVRTDSNGNPIPNAKRVYRTAIYYEGTEHGTFIIEIEQPVAERSFHAEIFHEFSSLVAGRTVDRYEDVRIDDLQVTGGNGSSTNYLIFFTATHCAEGTGSPSSGGMCEETSYSISASRWYGSDIYVSTVIDDPLPNFWEHYFGNDLTEVEPDPGEEEDPDEEDPNEEDPAIDIPFSSSDIQAFFMVPLSPRPNLSNTRSAVDITLNDGTHYVMVHEIGNPDGVPFSHLGNDLNITAIFQTELAAGALEGINSALRISDPMLDITDVQVLGATHDSRAPSTCPATPECIERTWSLTIELNHQGQQRNFTGVLRKVQVSTGFQFTIEYRATLIEQVDTGGGVIVGNNPFFMFGPNGNVIYFGENEEMMFT